MKKIKWLWFDFSKLSNLQLYELLKLRQNVFVIEQNSLYNDIDGIDPSCRHLLGLDGDSIVAYLRLLPKNLIEEGYVSFGRVLVKEGYRNKAWGIL